MLTASYSCFRRRLRTAARGLKYGKRLVSAYRRPKEKEAPMLNLKSVIKEFPGFLGKLKEAGAHASAEAERAGKKHAGRETVKHDGEKRYYSTQHSEGS